MINHRFKMGCITDYFRKEGYIVKQTGIGKLMIKNSDDKTQIASIYYETMRVEILSHVDSDTVVDIYCILENCEDEIKKNYQIREQFTVV